MATNKRLIKSNDEGGAASFNTVLWTGENQNVNRSISGVGFQPDFVWVKVRTYGGWSHQLYDSVRGAGPEKALHSNGTGAEGSGNEDTYGYLSSFDIDGFTGSVGTSTNEYFNTSLGYDMVAWCWKAGGSAVTNTDGTITSQVSANTEAGFSIVSYTGSGATATVGHGLNSVVDLLIVKGRETTNDWSVLHKDNTNGNFLQLNGTAAESGSGSIFGNPTARPTDSVFTIGNTGETGTLNKTYIAYCFAEVAGFSKFGSYTGNGSTNGATINCGFEPAFVMIKASSDAGVWVMHDNKRGNYNDGDIYARLQAESSGAEVDDYPTPTNKRIVISSTGFQVTNASNSWNGSGRTYIYMAFANQF